MIEAVFTTTHGTLYQGDCLKLMASPPPQGSLM